jgi:transcriptional regulator GlxA family with amidase domain
MERKLAMALALYLAVVRPASAEERLPLPVQGPVTVEFAISETANVMDLAGAWEVFQDARGGSGFRLLIVSDKKGPVHMTGGMVVTADYSYEDAPSAELVSVGAQRGSHALYAWLQKRHDAGGIIMSVCTGAFHLGAAGLLDGKPATTHHDYLSQFHKMFPTVILMPGNRYIRSEDRIFTAGGLTSGIDLALHMVALYYGESEAGNTANYLEYSGIGWRVPAGASPMPK